jgi:hypothetical protein
MVPGMTRKQMHLLLELVRKDARNHGYGTTYHVDNKREWPNRLHSLHAIAGKLIRQIEWKWGENSGEFPGV